jgi:ParB family chromosome partitioning protein
VTAATRPISSIRVVSRHRRDMGDVESLAASIRDIGLLHPVVIAPDGTLICGERRLRAAQELGWKSIPVRIVDIAAIARGELAENACRKDFTPSESVAIAATVEKHERALAKQRQSLSKGRGEKGRKTLPTLNGRALDSVGRIVGMSRPTLERARAVVEAAKAEPEKFAKLLDDMDRSGRVNGPFRRLQNAQQAALIRAEPPPLPGRGPYRVGNCDVPWPYEVDDDDPAHRGAWPFPTMSIDELCALPVSSIMHEDSIFWFWTTNFHMRHAFTILDAWGFPKTPTILTWHKDRPGHGHWLRGKTEHCIMAVRGKPIVTLTNQTTSLHAPVRGHSEKPREFYDLVESLCPAPRYADLFSRYQHNDKWDCHGDQAPLSATESES